MEKKRGKKLVMRRNLREEKRVFNNREQYFQWPLLIMRRETGGERGDQTCR